MKKRFDLIIFIFLLLSPLIDVLTGLQARYNIPCSLGVIIRGIILLVSIIYLYINKKHKSVLYLFSIFLALETLVLYFYHDSNILTEIKNIIIIFYLPLMVLFFSHINLSFILKINLIYLLILVIPYFIGVGFNTYSGLDGKSSYLSFFVDGNELSALLLLLLPLSISYLLQNKYYSYLIAFLLLHIIAALIIGTKVLLLGTFIVILYFAVKIIKGMESKKRNLFIVGIISFVVLGIIALPFTPVYKNLAVSLEYYNVNGITDIFKMKFIDNIIFSKRLSFAKDIFSSFNNSILNILFGVGRSFIILIKDVEIDLLDIVFSIGFVGLILYIYSFKRKCFELKGVYRFTFILLIIISFFSGHVLIKPMVATFLGVIFLLNKEENI